jgi:hypothetical protein
MLNDVAIQLPQAENMRMMCTLQRRSLTFLAPVVHYPTKLAECCLATLMQVGKLRALPADEASQCLDRVELELEFPLQHVHVWYHWYGGIITDGVGAPRGPASPRARCFLLEVSIPKIVAEIRRKQGQSGLGVSERQITGERILVPRAEGIK